MPRASDECLGVGQQLGGRFSTDGNWDNGEKREIHDGEMESKREAESDEGRQSRVGRPARRAGNCPRVRVRARRWKKKGGPCKYQKAGGRIAQARPLLQQSLEIHDTSRRFFFALAVCQTKGRNSESVVGRC